MTSSTAIETTGNRTVGMGRIAVAEGPICLSAVLGSCVGVTLHHRRSQRGNLAHVVLPRCSSQSSGAGKFADTAIPQMLRWFEQRGTRPADLVAKIVGGACMFGNGGPMQIGQTNVDVATQLLRDVGVRIAGKDVGGTSGRRITFDCSTGLVTVETVGNPCRTL